jgi:DNA-binding PadR family transcriptional regulator
MNATEKYQGIRSRFIRNFLDITLIRMLSDEAMWGYNMMSRLKEVYGVKVGPSVIYPLLETMEKDGLIEAEEVFIGKRRRKIYRPTQKGLEYLESLVKAVSEILEKSN